MTLSTKEKRAISHIIAELSDYKVINREATNLPLHYIPEASHSMQDIIYASHDLNDDAISQQNINNSPLLLALDKIRPYIRIDKSDEYYKTHPITINLALWGFKTHSIHIASELYGNCFEHRVD